MRKRNLMNFSDEILKSKDDKNIWDLLLGHSDQIIYRIYLYFKRRMPIAHVACFLGFVRPSSAMSPEHIGPWGVGLNTNLNWLNWLTDWFGGIERTSSEAFYLAPYLMGNTFWLTLSLWAKSLCNTYLAQALGLIWISNTWP